MMVFAPVQIKIALLDQICYMLKEMMLHGQDDSRQIIVMLF